MLDYESILRRFSRKPSVKLLNFHIALYYRDVLERPMSIYDNMTGRLRKLFNMTPGVLQYPHIDNDHDHLDNTSFVTLVSSQSGYRGSISHDRCDFSYGSSEPTHYSIIKKLFDYGSDFIDLVYDKRSISKIQCELVGSIQLNDPIRVITNRYCNSTMHACNDIAVRFNKIVEHDCIHLNNIIGVNNSQMSYNHKPIADVIMIERDINTIDDISLMTRQQCKSILNFIGEQYTHDNVIAVIKD